MLYNAQDINDGDDVEKMTDERRKSKYKYVCKYGDKVERLYSNDILIHVLSPLSMSPIIDVGKYLQSVTNNIFIIANTGFI